MLSHMLFNRLKWWNVDDNADKATINGRDYIATPKKIRVPARAQVYIGSETYYASEDQTIDILGKTTNDKYVFDPHKFDADGVSLGDGYDYGIINCKDATPIWGGKRLLSHVYQALRRVVIA